MLYKGRKGTSDSSTVAVRYITGVSNSCPKIPAQINVGY